MPTHAHGTLRSTDHSIGFDEKPTEKPTEKSSVSLLFGLNRPTFGGKTEKPTEALFTFGSQHCLGLNPVATLKTRQI